MHASEHNCLMEINSFIKPFVNSFFYYSLHLQLPHTMLNVESDYDGLMKWWQRNGIGMGHEVCMGEGK